MYTVTASAFPTLPTTPQASVASMIAPAEPVLGRLPAVQVPGPVAQPEMHNDTANHPAYVAPEEVTEVAEDATAAPAGAVQLTDDSAINGFPSLFLTQLIGQDSGDAQAQSVISSYAQAAIPAAQNAASNPAAEFIKVLQAGTVPQTASTISAAALPPAAPRIATVRTYSGAHTQTRGNKAYGAMQALGETIPEETPEETS